MLRKKKRIARQITFIGAHPPTVGGVSIHVQRLARLAFMSGRDVKVLDPYTRNRDSSGEQFAYSLVRTGGFLGKFLLVWELLLLRSSVVHLHLSHVGSVMATALVIALCYGSRIIVTIHSGNFPKQLQMHSKTSKKLLAWSLMSCSKIICVSGRLRDALVDFYPDFAAKTSVITPYLPAPETTNHLPSEDRTVRILAAGYGTTTYDWLTLLDSMEELLPMIDLHLVFYNTYDKDYFPKVIARVSEIGGPITVHYDLNQDEFAGILATSHVFVRPTLTDGDSIAVREALALGVHVVASDACERPLGCHLFPVGDSKRLKEAVSKVLNTPKRPVRDGHEHWQSYAQVYAEETAISSSSLKAVDK